MSEPRTARAAGKDFLKRTEYVGAEDGLRVTYIEARRVVTALLEALRPFTELARFAEGDTRPKVTTELTASPMTRDGTPGAAAGAAGAIYDFPEGAILDFLRDEDLEIRRRSAPQQGVSEEYLAARIAFLLKEARPALTVETLAALLREWSADDPAQLFTDDEWCAALAAYLLPRLAGPAQEGPQ